jgi:hypothetical protein
MAGFILLHIVDRTPEIAAAKIGTAGSCLIE